MKSNDKTLTPLMEQYFKIKDSYKDCLLFFRLGDFYELFCNDAIIASKELNIVLTKRGNRQNNDGIPMCGIPYHACDSYIERLIKSGFKVAICEQMEDPSKAKKQRGYNAIVKRDVVRIITPGTIVEDKFLQSDKNNYLLAVYKNTQSDKSYWITSWIDISTSEFYVKSFLDKSVFDAFINQLNPAEIIISDELILDDSFGTIKKIFEKKITLRPDFIYLFDKSIKEHISKSLKIQDVSSIADFSNDELVCIKSLIDYVKLTNKCDTVFFKKIQKEELNEELFMDEFTFKSLEVVSSMNPSFEKYSTLFDVINETCSNIGTRLLKNMIIRPITNVKIINDRLDAIEFFIKNQLLISEIRDELKCIPDIKRVLSKISFNKAGPRDLYSVLNYILVLPKIKAVLVKGGFPQNNSKIVSSMVSNIDISKYLNVISELEKSLNSDNLPLLARDGGFIKVGYDQQLDEYNSLVNDTSNVILSLQSEYSEELGISKLRIKHNNILGYFIEFPIKSSKQSMINKSKFIHRQTTSNVIRYTTVKLSELENKIINAKDKSQAIELDIFDKLCSIILNCIDDLMNTADILANLDVFSSLAMLAIRENYTRPIVDNSSAFKIIGGRHPVVEKNMKQKSLSSFIDNDCILQDDKNGNSVLWLITGPNMAGKSTFLRQNAIITLLAHSGFYVPATSAHIGIIDKLFSRVGASDSLATGKSTFMVEMVETAAILNKATDKSFVILDEIGRGTSTFDGMSIAYGVVEYLCKNIKCRGLFATHYHELTDIQNTQKNITCHTMQIKEWKDEIIFLYKVILGIAKKSYGIAVAKLAGVPKEVISRANVILSNLEHSKVKENYELFKDMPDNFVHTENEYNNLLQILNDVDPDLISPKEALDIIYKLKNSL